MSEALALEGICKSFGDTRANHDVGLTVAAGSIHGLIGENGAGKSTLMSILSGLMTPDAGTIRVGGHRRRFASVAEARACGIGMVHQHFMLVDPMDAVDNILLANGSGWWLARSRRSLRDRIAKAATDYGLDVTLDVPVGALSVGARQRIEILKELVRGARILILDEPTAVLTPAEAASLFALMRAMRDAGCSLIFVSHKLEEIMAVTDHVSVMRHGEMVLHAETGTTSPDALAQAMMGHAPAPPVDIAACAAGATVLRATGLCTRATPGSPGLLDISFQLRAGEITGIAGVAGNGQTELLDALMGLEPLASGEIEIAGRCYAASQIAVPAMRGCDIAYVPEDRMRRGLVADMPAQESIRLGRERREATRGCRTLMQDWDVRPQDPQRLTRNFSGGNQQKLILARELEHPPKVLLIGQPTRGVDLAAARLIHDRLRALRIGGCAILLVSTDLDELMSLCDRILVMHRGAITGMRRPAETNRHELGLLMAGQALRASA